MKKLMVAVVGACASLVSFAYDWTGKTGVVTLTETAEVTDADAATVAALDGIVLEGAETDIIFLNTTALTLSGYISGDGRIIKRGTGDLLFGSPHEKTVTYPNSSPVGNNLCGDYYTTGGIVIETGTVMCPQAGGVGMWFGPIQINAGATFVMPKDKNCGVDALSGDGTFKCDNSEVGWYHNPEQHRALSIGNYGSGRICSFGGTFEGCLQISACCDVSFTGTTSHQGAGLTAIRNGWDTAKGTAQLAKFGMKAPIAYRYTNMNDQVFVDYPSSLGAGSSYHYGVDFDITYSGRIRYIGDEDDETNKKFRFGSVYMYGSPNTLDGGHHGGVTFTGEWGNYGGPGSRGSGGGAWYKVNGACLTGSNTVDMVLKNKIDSAEGCLFFRKEGTGAWRLSGSASQMQTYVGAWHVNDGTLKFDSIADIGTSCSMGTAANCLKFTYEKDVYNATNGALRLGSELVVGTYNGGAAIPTLEYTGTAVNSTDRRIGLIGQGGRLASKTPGGVIRFLGGVYPMATSNAVALARTVETDAKTLYLDASGDGNEVGHLSENEAGTLSLVKEGAGMWTVRNDFSVSGGIDVKEGTLRIAPKGDYPFTWYRFTITQVNRKSNDGSTNQYIWLKQLGLFDEDGNRVATNLEYLGPDPDTAANWHNYAGNYDWTALQPGQVTMGEFKPGNAGGAAGKGIMISKNQTPGNLFLDDTSNLRATLNYPNGDSNSNYYFPIVFRLPKGSATPRYYDIVQHVGHDGGDHVACFKLEASADGVTWTELDHQTECKQRAASVWWSTGVAVTNGVSQNCKELGFGYPIKGTTEDESETVDLSSVSAIKVAAGATLESFPPKAVTLPKLTVDCAGTGVATVKGFKIAETGVLTLANAPKGDVKLPVSFADCTDLKNLEGWTATVEGGTRNRYAIEVSDGEVTLKPFGMAILIR